MNRYRSSRKSSSSPLAVGPIVAFLLIASFGLLFVTGCSRTVGGPDESERFEDETFTADDLARFQQLTRLSDTSGTGDILASSDRLRTQTGSVSPVTIDPAVKQRYDAVRASSTGGENLYRVTNEFLNVRSSPNVSASSVGRLNQGDLVTLLEFTNAGWAKVSAPGIPEGYVASRYVSKLTTEEKLKDEQKVFEGMYFVDFTFVNVRKSPDSGSEKLGELPSQSFVKPISIDKEWARIAFEGKEGFVSMEYLAPFTPNFLVRQERYTLPILHYHADQEGVVEALAQHATRLKQDGVKLLTFREMHDTILAQETRDVRFPPRAALLVVTGLTPTTIKKVSDALIAANVNATLFLQTDQVGVSGISEKTILSLQANGFDIQSAGHTGDDLRTLTDAQMQLELEQSRAILEGLTHKSVFAIAYPQGGTIDRVLKKTADAGYLFGLGSAPETTFNREQFLRLPSITITSGMTPEDVLALTKP